jgi:hypothetical protein
MSSRKDICTPRQSKDGKTFWTRIGTAWFNDNGNIQLVFDALPIADSEGRVVANLFDPKGQEPTRQQSQQRQPAPAYDDDDPRYR